MRMHLMHQDTAERTGFSFKRIDKVRTVNGERAVDRFHFIGNHIIDDNERAINCYYTLIWGEMICRRKRCCTRVPLASMCWMMDIRNISARRMRMGPDWVVNVCMPFSHLPISFHLSLLLMFFSFFFLLLLQTVSVTVSVLTLTFISLDRWYAICFPLRYVSTNGRAIGSIAFIWTLALVSGESEYSLHVF